MTKITAWELRKSLRKVLADASLGKRFQVEKHGKIVAEIGPPSPCDDSPGEDCEALVDPYELPSEEQT